MEFSAGVDAMKRIWYFICKMFFVGFPGGADVTRIWSKIGSANLVHQELNVLLVLQENYDYIISFLRFYKTWQPYRYASKLWF